MGLVPGGAGRWCGSRRLPADAWAPIADQLGLDVAGVHSHAVSDAPMSGHRSTHPVLLLSPSGFSPLLLTTLAEQLASVGYVVVGINHTYETAVSVFADGRVVPMNPAALGGALGPQGGPHDEAFERRRQVCEYKTSDLSSVADHLARLDVHPTGLAADRFDLTRLGAVGHSFGGNAALEWCRIDPRCRAAANLDGALWTDVGTLGLARPVLQLLAEHPEFTMSSADAVAAGIAPDAAWYEAERAITFGGWHTVSELGPQAHTLQIAGATHLSFMDLPFLAVRDGSPVVPMLATTTIDPTRMARITGEIVQAFFDQHLDGRPNQLLDRPDLIGPEVTLGPPPSVALTPRHGGR